MPGKHRNREARNQWRRKDYAKRKAAALAAARKPTELVCSHCGGSLLLDRNTMALIEERTLETRSPFDVELAGILHKIPPRRVHEIILDIS